MDSSLTKHLRLITILSCMILIMDFASVNSQSVYFGTPNNIAVVGQRIEMFCSTTRAFDPTRDEVEVYFRKDLLMMYSHGNVTYHKIDRPTTYYSTDIFRSDHSDHIGVGFIINKIHANDAGEYQCIITVGGEKQSPRSLDIRIGYIPNPTCIMRFPPSTNGGVLICKVSSNVDIPVILQWSRSDTGLLPQPHDIQPSAGANVSVPISASDNGVIFTCTSSNPNYRGFTETCAMKVNGISEEIIHPSTSSQATPAQHTTDRDMKINSNSSSHMITHKILEGTEGEAGKSSKVPAGLIAGASAVIGVFCLSLIVVISCVCVSRLSKRRIGSGEYRVHFIHSDEVDKNRLSMPTDKEKADYGTSLAYY